MRLHTLTLTLMFLLFYVPSTFSDAVTVEGQGPLIKKSTASKLPAFSKVKTLGSINVMIDINPSQQVMIEAQETLFPIIKTEVVAGELQISTTDSYMTQKPISVFVSMPSLDHLESQGSGHVKVDHLASPNLLVEHLGSGSIQLSGKVDELYASVSGSGSFEAKALQIPKAVKLEHLGSGEVYLVGKTERFLLHQSGSGQIKAKNLQVRDIAELHVLGSGIVELCALNEAKGALTGSGDIILYCHPKRVNISHLGSGSLRQE